MCFCIIGKEKWSSRTRGGEYMEWARMFFHVFLFLSSEGFIYPSAVVAFSEDEKFFKASEDPRWVFVCKGYS